MRQLEIIFIPTAFFDPRKHGSTLELHREFKGLLDIKRNIVYFSDVNGQEWTFWIGETAQFVDFANKDDLNSKEVYLYDLFSELQREHDYSGKCVEDEMNVFMLKNNITNPLINYGKEEIY